MTFKLYMCPDKTNKFKKKLPRPCSYREKFRDKIYRGIFFNRGISLVCRDNIILSRSLLRL
jgi:hypothetical protein